MHKLLQSIIDSTTKDVEKRKKSYLSFKESILNPKFGDIGLIAEIKLASPTEGNLGKKANVLERLKLYQETGADAVSVITEKKTFKGDLNLVSAIKTSIVRIPVLQKDFVIDDFQIKESRRLGADALLLIAGIIDGKQLKRFVKLCQKLQLEPVVEICNEDDLTKAVKSETMIIAVNARDLDTFEVDVDRACKLLNKVPEKFLKLGFSGIHSRSEVEKYKKAGAKAVLVGTDLMKTNNIRKFIQKLKTLVKVKICGVRSIEAAKTATEAGADFLGFNFVPGSKRYIDPILALEIINSIRGQIKTVGIFRDDKIAEVNKIVSGLKLDFAQLHGNENSDYISKVKIPVIKSMTVDDDPNKIKADYFLLDRSKRGEGEMVDLEKASRLTGNFPIFIAGGLTPDNVASVVSQIRPFAVDVAGGVETDGHQDIEKVKLFIRNAKGESL